MAKNPLSTHLKDVSQTDIELAMKSFRKVDAEQITDLFRLIGYSGYSSITSRIQMVDLIWDSLETMRAKLAPADDFVVWERYSQSKLCDHKNLMAVPTKPFVAILIIASLPCMEITEGMYVQENTYLIWHDLARFKDVLALYRPATIKDARSIITAVKNGDETSLMKYCLDDSPDVIIEKVKAASGDQYGSRGGMGRTGRREIAPLDKALLQFTQASSKCLAMGIELKELTKRLKLISNEPE